MGTHCLCSTLCRFRLDYPEWLVSHNRLHNGPKRLQAAASSTIGVCQERRKPITAVLLAAACAVIVSVNGAAAAQVETQQEMLGENFLNVPQTLSGDCVDGQKDCKKARIQRPKSRQAETCTVKCVNTCIRGGSGSPGEGPLNVRRLEDGKNRIRPLKIKWTTF